MPDDTAGQNTEFSLRPAFIGWSTVLGQIPYHLILAMFAITFGGFLGGAMSEPPDFLVPYPYLLVPPAIVLAVSPFLLFRAKRRRHRRTEYRFFRDRLEFDNGYVFPYRNVRSVILRRGLFGRISGLGTLHLKANIEGFAPLFPGNFGAVTKDGILLRDIPDPDQARTRIQALIDAQQH